MKYLLFLGLVITSLICSAAIYMQIDENGNTSYSDTPTANSKQVHIPSSVIKSTTPKNIFTDNNAVKENNDKKTAVVAETHLPYKKFIISSPADQYTFQNQRDIAVEISIEPELQAGDKIILYLDGNSYGPAVATTRFSLLQLERGTHQISAALLDAKQTVLNNTGPITIYIHYAHI
jgi:hypothetical protein